MRPAEGIFKYRSLNEETLIPYGFIRDDKGYLYNVPFMDGEFHAEIRIGTDGNVVCRAIDTDSEEEYLPVNLDGQTGAFIGRVREEYYGILEQVWKIVVRNLWIFIVRIFWNLVYHSQNDYSWCI